MTRAPISQAEAALARRDDVRAAVDAYRKDTTPKNLHLLQSILAAAGVPPPRRRGVLKAVLRIGGPNFGEEGYIRD